MKTLQNHGLLDMDFILPLVSLTVLLIIRGAI